MNRSLASISILGVACLSPFAAGRPAWAQTGEAAPPPPASAAPAPAAPPEGAPPPPADSGPAAAPKAAGPEEAPASAEEVDARLNADHEEWAARDREVNESNTLSGGAGLLRTQHASIGSPGQFRLGFVTEWFSAGFLCTNEFPCPSATPGGQPITSDTLNHTGATISLGVSIVKLGPGILEGYATTGAYANSDTANSPSLLQVLGDTNLGIKYAAPIGDVLRLGVFTELWLLNGLGAVGLDGSGTSAKFGGIATTDLRGMSSHIPLRFSLNLIYALDNSADVVTLKEQQRGAALHQQGVTTQPVTRIERYGLGINRVDHFDMLLGAEGLFVEERIRPFVEARILIPNNRQGYQCAVDTNGNPTNPSGDMCMGQDALVPSTLTLGARFFPWKRGFSLLAAVDIGLTGVANFIEELQPTPPWTLYLGGGWAVDTLDRPPVVKRVAVAKAVESKPLVHVVGLVHEKDKNDPVGGAVLSYHDHADMYPLATGPDGKFGDDVPVGTYTLDVKADGYKPGSCEANASAAKPASQVDVDCALEALPRMGSVVGHVRDSDSNAPLGGVQVVLTDNQHKELRVASDASGGFRFDGVAPGTAEASVIADGYLAFFAPADVKPRQESTLDLLLRPTPKQSKVQVSAKEIAIKDQIQFALDSAVILPQSFGVLSEVADTLIRHADIRRLEVQGHTDNSGTAEHNRTLSEERAEAVRAWLVQHGVGADRLAARGYGQDNPLVPNVTAGNRSRNRRVQFIITDKAAAAPAPPATPSTPSPSGPAPAAPRKPNPLPGF